MIIFNNFRWVVTKFKSPKAETRTQPFLHPTNTHASRREHDTKPAPFSPLLVAAAQSCSELLGARARRSPVVLPRVAWGRAVLAGRAWIGRRGEGAGRRGGGSSRTCTAHLWDPRSVTRAAQASEARRAAEDRRTVTTLGLISIYLHFTYGPSVSHQKTHIYLQPRAQKLEHN